LPHSRPMIPGAPSSVLTRNTGTCSWIVPSLKMAGLHVTGPLRRGTR
jgi:hypothetical protein